MELLDHGERKFPNAMLKASSDGLPWRGIAAEMRSHPAGDLPPFRADQLEITIALAGERDAMVSRKGAGVRQQTRVDPGAIWISPVGVSEDDIRITRPLSRILHVYLPTEAFARLSSAGDGPVVSSDSIRYLAGLRDDLIHSVGIALLAELTAPSAAGRVLADALALTARLAQKYAAGCPFDADTSLRRYALHDARVRRVVDFVRAHLEDDIGLDDMAAVACLSPFHFARLFRRQMGVPPHHYLAQLRLEAAKARLAHGTQPVAEIAAACRFSNQANFARAFRQFTGMTPLEFRRASGAPAAP